MKNIVSKIVAPFAVIAGLAGCVSAPVAQRVAEPEKPVAEIPRDAQKKSEWEVNLGNGYKAESPMEEAYLKTIAGLVRGDITAKKTDKGYITDGTFNRMLYPEIFDKICKIVDKNGNKVITFAEAMKAYLIACKNATENK